jgi:hypothetical protein
MNNFISYCGVLETLDKLIESKWTARPTYSSEQFDRIVRKEIPDLKRIRSAVASYSNLSYSDYMLLVELMKGV